MPEVPRYETTASGSRLVGLAQDGACQRLHAGSPDAASAQEAAARKAERVQQQAQPRLTTRREARQVVLAALTRDVPQPPSLGGVIAMPRALGWR